MMITLRLFASLRDAVGQKEVKIDRAEATLQQVLEDLAASHDPRVRDIVFDQNGEIWQSVMLLVNGQPIERDPAAPLKSGDTLSILLPTAGG
jgi:MoaD family protein